MFVNFFSDESFWGLGYFLIFGYEFWFSIYLTLVLLIESARLFSNISFLYTIDFWKSTYDLLDISFTVIMSYLCNTRLYLDLFMIIVHEFV